MDHKIHVVKQHPLRLPVPLNLIGPQLHTTK